MNSGRYNTSAAKHNIGQAVSPLSLVLPDGASRTDQRAGPQLCSQHGQPRVGSGTDLPFVGGGGALLRPRALSCAFVSTSIGES